MDSDTDQVGSKDDVITMAEHKLKPSGSTDDNTSDTEEGDTGSNSATQNSRAERFKALQARAKKSLEKNRIEVYAERKRQASDPREVAALQRKKTEAEFNLAKVEAAENGEDFERKRAWDWTIEESEKWDKRIEKKKRKAADAAFSDYTQNARKVYKRQLENLPPDLETYARQKLKVIKDGQVHETTTGELVAVDANGDFYADTASLAFVDNKPSRAAVDRLVQDLQKADEIRRKRFKKGDDDDVTYINDKNKQFNQKLARYYNKYTTEIRDSFERGTMI